MLHEFLAANRDELIERCNSKVAGRPTPDNLGAKTEHGIPDFLDQLIRTLREEHAPRVMPGGDGAARDRPDPVASELGATAVRHGRELLQHGFVVGQVVHDYGDVCQAVTDLAFEREAQIDVGEFRTLNRCLDNAIADAVTEFAYQRDMVHAEQGAQALNERLGFLAHELRNLVNTATLAVIAIKAGNVGLGGAVGGILDRSLIGIRNLVDRSLAEVRVTAGMPGRRRRVSLAELIVEATVSASLEAQARGCELRVSRVDPGLAVEVDRDMLLSAVGNLLQNAFKFTAPGTEVSLGAYTVGDRILIDVEDCCGGLPPGNAERLFQPFNQGGADKSGLGLGLSICRRGVEANDGVLTVRDKPGSGCVFTIALPRSALPV